MRRRWVAALLVAVLLVAGCSGKKKPQIPAEDLWSEANEAFDDEAWEYAVERYKLLLEQYPFDPNAEEAELRIARAHYLSGKYPEAIASLGDFERMHPTSPNLPFVEYHLGMSYLAQSSTSDRDPAPHTSALAYFKNVIDRFPTSPWAERARLRLRECQESLARHDAGIAAYYLKRGNLRAAEGRLRGILQDYPGTSAAGDMLYTFAGEYARRDEAEGATLALATLVKYHGDEKVGREAKEKLGSSSTAADGMVEGQDPLGLLIARIDRMAADAARQNVPKAVSAYPEIGGSGQRY
jgi:outer membrane protein assembly factor BamD